jgi:2-iminobutanoate/2-iminopropanoate deaminase
MTSSLKSVVSTASAAPAAGPYSQAIVYKDLVFASGQLPIIAGAGTMPEGVEAQTHQSLMNLRAVLEAGGATLNSVTKTTVFLKNMDDFAKMNAVYSEYFSESPPARSTVEVARLPRDALVEVEAVAIVTKEPGI